MARNKYAYDQQYIKQNLVMKHITFNRLKEDDMQMLDWINAQDNATQYIKRLIREDMEKSRK